MDYYTYAPAYAQGIGFDCSRHLEEGVFCSYRGPIYGSFQPEPPVQLNCSPPQLTHNVIPSWYKASPRPHILPAHDHMAQLQLQWLNKIRMAQCGDYNGAEDYDQLSPEQYSDFLNYNSNQLNGPTDRKARIAGELRKFLGTCDNAVQQAEWDGLYSLSSADIYVKSALPELVHEYAAQQHCAFTSTSDCLQYGADSPGSSERERSFSRSTTCLSSPDDISWPSGSNADSLLDDNFGVLSASGFSTPAENPVINDDCSVFPWMSQDQAESADMSTGAIVNSASSLNNQERVTVDRLRLSPSSITRGYNYIDDLSPCKRQKVACYPLESMINPVSQPLGIPFLQSLEFKNAPPVSSDYPMTQANISEALDFQNFSKWQIPSSRALKPPTPSAPVHGVVRRIGPTHDALVEDDGKVTRSPSKPSLPATSIEPQSVAARKRRKKISDRIRHLEKLVPGGSKLDTAKMLDESIEYVKFLQLQVQLLESLGNGPEEPGASPTLADTSHMNDRTTAEENEAGFGSESGNWGPCTRVPTWNPCTQAPVQPALGPLVVSEILQEQLFKRGLCIGSLHQRSCLQTPRFSTSSAQL